MRSFLIGTCLFICATCLFAQQSIDLTQTNSDFYISGDQTNDYFGRAVAVGDFNGDGVDDLVAGAYGADKSGRSTCGNACIFWGGSDLSGEWDLNQDAADVTIWGAAEGDNFAFAVAAGDINDDGIDDLIISSHNADPGGLESAGEVYIFFGSSAFPQEIDLATESADVVIHGKHTNAQLGFPLETGDFNADGKPDLFIGAYLSDYNLRPSPGYVLVFWGRSELEWEAEYPSAISGADQIFLGQNNDRLGRSIFCADFDGDGKKDLALGAYYAEDEVGKVYVFKGGIERTKLTDLRISSAEKVIYGADTGGIFGVEINAGDVNGDGFADLAVSAAWAKPDDTRLTGGKVYLFYGGALFFDMPAWDLNTKSADYEYWGQNRSDNLGMSIWISDFNADSKNDVIMGAPSARNMLDEKAGNVFIDYGPLTATAPVDFATATADFRLAGYSEEDRLGWVSAMGDLNNDSIMDLIAGADGSDPGGRTNAGAVHVMWGNAAPQAPELQAPENNVFVNSSTVVLQWLKPVDLNDAELTYQVVLKIAGESDSLLIDSAVNPEKFTEQPEPGSSETLVETQVELQNELSPGATVSWYVRASDGIITGANSSVYQFRFDDVAPEVVPSFPKKVLAGEGFQISAQVSDAVAGIENVVLNFRQGGESAFESMNMLTTGGAIFQNSISGLEVTAKGVEFYIAASDAAGNITRLPQNRNYSIQVRVEDDGITQSFSGGTTKNAYRLISLPLVADEPEAGPILAEEFGDYNQQEWRFFSYENQAFVENSSNAEFTPGTSHFLISKSNYSLSSGAGISALTENVFQLQVPTGWSLIGNPFYFTVPTSNFALDGAAVSLLHYSGGEWQPLANMSPWSGGIVYNASSTAASLTIDPDVSVAVAKNNADDENEFQIQLIAKCGEVRDSYNIAAVHSTARDAWDSHDCAEPPVIGEYVSLYFEDNENPARLTKSCLPPAETGYEWTLGLLSNQTAKAVEIELGPDTRLPDGFKALLVDESGRCLLDLQQQTTLLLPQQPNQPQTLKLMVRKSSDPSQPGSMPESFELNQNFPNPFNLRQGVTQTRIVFSVPEQSALSLTVYNVLGAEIKSLILNGDYAPGQHVLVWDGRDNNGMPAANGVYFYRMVTSQGIQTRKMLLVR